MALGDDPGDRRRHVAVRCPGARRGYRTLWSLESRRSLVKSRLQTIGVVDMRYPNGFALKASKS